MSKDGIVEIYKRRRKRARRLLHKSREGGRHILRIKKTNMHIYLLVLSHKDGRTLFSSSSLQLGLSNGGLKNIDRIVDSLLQKLKEKKIQYLSLNRGAHSYHGKIQLIREKLLSSGIKI